MDKVLLMVVQLPIQIISVIFINSVQKPKLKAWLNIVIVTCASLLFQSMSLIFDTVEPFGTLTNVFIIIYFFACYKEKASKKLLNLILYFSLLFSIDMLVYFTLTVIGMEPTDKNFEYISPLVVAFFEAVAFYFVSVYIKQRKVENINRKSYIFLLIPFTHVLNMVALANLLRFYSGAEFPKNLNLSANTIIALVFVTLAALSLIVDVIAFRQYIKSLDVAKFKAENDKLKYKNELNIKYFNELKENEDELRKIKHDLNGSLEIVKELMYDKENIDKAQVLFDELSSTVKSIDTGFYCHNSLINAILLNRSKLCAESHIRFKTEIQLNEDVVLEVSAVCRALLNILDNAIEANQRIDDVSKRYITFSIKTADGYFFIKSENPYTGTEFNTSRTSKADKKSHGFGTNILKQFAEKYDGEYMFTSENGCINTSLYLKNK